MKNCDMCGGDETTGEMTSGLTGPTGGNPGEPRVSYMHCSPSSCQAVKAKYADELEKRVSTLEYQVKELRRQLISAFDVIAEIRR